jgi:F0F1-type ATP synthase membrane subunit c/vacuolar-type H+-ATPase subunit K
MRKSIGTVALTLLLGVLIGAICSELIGLVMREGSVAEQLFVRYVSFGPEVVTLKLVIIDLTFGFKIHFNLMSLIGVFVAAQILRWYR